MLCNIQRCQKTTQMPEFKHICQTQYTDARKHKPTQNKLYKCQKTYTDARQHTQMTDDIHIGQKTYIYVYVGE